MPDDPQKPESGETAGEKLLRQIRDDFRYVRAYWHENHEEAEKDMDCVAGVPPADFRDDRKGRPCIWPDETSQYVKQANNNLRQNKRSIKISPKSEDATDQDAEHRQAYIRGIEYASKAQSIYSTAFESAVQCGFGYWRIKTIVVGPNGEQEPRLKRIDNWSTVYPDPDASEADFSDQNICFVIDSMRTSKFVRKYPKANKKSFSGDDANVAPGWLTGDNIIVAEYWLRTEYEEKGETRHKVKQYITNGFEILETNEWIGSSIPIVGVFGEELYVKSAGTSKRLFMSLIRRMRGPQQMLAYVASQEAEEFQLAPRAPLQGFKGQFDSELHKNVHKLPRAYLEFKLPTDWNVQWGPPPLPSRVQFIPNIQQYEAAYEQWRRAIQAAAGITPLPTAAQRQNEKSGVALERIQTQEAIGSYHFLDNFVRSLDNTGRQLNEAVTKLAELDSLPKQLLGKDQADEDVQLRVAPRDRKFDPESEELPEGHDWFFAHRGQFEVTISDGPSYQSQREEASDFSDTLLNVMPKLGMPPQILQEMLAIAVRLKNIGTFGDEIADLLSPPDPNNLPPQAKALLAQAQGTQQQLMAELQQLRLEKMGKVIEIQGKQELAKQEFVTRMSEADKDRETKLAVAEVSTKAQIISERVAAVEDLMKQFHQQAHELAMTFQQHAQNQELAQQQADNTSMQSAQDAAQSQAEPQAAAQ